MNDKIIVFIKQDQSLYPFIYIEDSIDLQSIIKKMNKSFETNIQSVSHYLPKIGKLNSEVVGTLRHKGSLNTDRYSRTQSNSEINSSKLMSTRKIVNLDGIKNVQEYDKMNQKELLREHENLLRVIKKFQEIIDQHLSKKKRQLRSTSTHSTTKPSSTKQQLMKCQIANNKKIIENYQREIKQLQSVKNQRKLNDVIEEKITVNNEITQLKKQIFNLKNDNNMAGRNLVENRPQIERELKQIQKDLKMQLTKKHDYIKKVDDLTSQLNKLKKECEGVNANQILSNQKSTSHSMNLLMKLSTKKAQLEDLRKQREQIELTIQDSIVSKAKRNKNLRKDIQNCQKRTAQMNTKILQYKDKITRYQKAMDILPKTPADDKLTKNQSAILQTKQQKPQYKNSQD